jgi:hypothetical protein
VKPIVEDGRFGSMSRQWGKNLVKLVKDGAKFETAK